jgi:hypothetical protein
MFSSEYLRLVLCDQGKLIPDSYTRFNQNLNISEILYRWTSHLHYTFIFTLFTKSTIIAVFFVL